MNDAPILVVSNAPADAELAAQPLRREFKRVEISCRADSVLADFERCKPTALVLAYRDLGEAEHHYAVLRRAGGVADVHAHRALVLCRTEDVARAYAMCKGGSFDDYVQFWPMTFDVLRLSMSVLHAVRDLHIVGALQCSANELMAHARRVAAIDPFLTQALAEGEQLLARTAEAVHQFERPMASMADPAADAVLAPAAAALDGGEQPTASRQSLFERVEALAEWSAELRRQSEPHLQAVRALQRAAQRKPGAGDTPEPPSVLVVEDDEFQQKIMRRMLGLEQLDHEVAGTGAAALEAIRRRRPTLVLLDYMLPDTNGVALLRLVRARPELAALPVIMLTGNGDKQIVVASMQAGASDFMVKPISAERLREKLRRYIVPAP